MLTLSAYMKFTANPQMMEQVSKQLGYPPSLLTPLGILEISCVIVYAIPRTADWVLRRGDLDTRPGGRRLRSVGDVLVWLGLYLRDARVRALIPLISASR